MVFTPPDCSESARCQSRIEQYLLLFVLCAICLLYLYLANYAFGDGMFMPTCSDEYEYQKNMESFLANNNLITSLALEENYAKIFGSSGHGFLYTLTNGLFAKIAWATPNAIIQLNFLLIALSLLQVVSLQMFSARDKLFIASALLLYPVVITYSFFYMTEMYQLFFAVTLALLIVRLYLRHRDGKPIAKLLLLFYLCVIVATMYRQTWALWGAAVIPLGNNKKQLAAYSGGLVLLLGYAYLFSSYFLAFYPYDPRIFIFTAFREGAPAKGLVFIYDNLVKNIRLYFTLYPGAGLSLKTIDFGFATRIALLGLTLYYSFCGVIRKSRYHLLAALLFWANLIPLFLLFTMENSAAQRHLAPLYYFSVIHLVAVKSSADRFVGSLLLVLLILILWPVTAGSVYEIKAKKLLAVYRSANAGSLESIATMIAEKVTEDGLTTIHVANEIPLDDSVILYSLPVKTLKGGQIRYTMNPQGRNLRLLNKVKVSYLLIPSSSLVLDQHLEFVAEAGNIRLYRILGYPENGLIKHLSLVKP